MKRYDIGDEVLIHYWYNYKVTPVVIKDKKGLKFLVSHNVDGSKIFNAPDEYIKISEIIDIYRK